MPGAAQLTVRAAQRAGAGLVTLAAFTRDVFAHLSGASPETLLMDLSQSKALFAGQLPQEVVDHRHDARVVGPGLGRTSHVRELVRCLLADDFGGPLVLDADALNVVGPAIEALGAYEGPLVLTPHPGEAERLLGRAVTADEEGRIACAREIQRRSGATCVLKGLGTVVTDGERLHVNETGNAGMATAGAGDVLSGILGAYLAYAAQRHDSGWSTFDAVAAAVHVHGLAGDLAAREHGARGLIASDLIDFLPAAQLAFGRVGD